jgi:hypothetical protein
MGNADRRDMTIPDKYAFWRWPARIRQLSNQLDELKIEHERVLVGQAKLLEWVKITHRLNSPAEGIRAMIQQGKRIVPLLFLLIAQSLWAQPAPPILRQPLTTNSHFGPTPTEGQVPIWNAAAKKWSNNVPSGGIGFGALVWTNDGTAIRPNGTLAGIAWLRTSDGSIFMGTNAVKQYSFFGAGDPTLDTANRYPLVSLVPTNVSPGVSRWGSAIGMVVNGPNQEYSLVEFTGNYDPAGANTESGLTLKSYGAVNNTEIILSSINDAGNHNASLDLIIPGGINIDIAAESGNSHIQFGSGIFKVDNNGDISAIKNVFYSWPASQGAAGTVLTNNGAGILGWGTDQTGAGGLTTNANQFLGVPLAIKDGVFLTNVNIESSLQVSNGHTYLAGPVTNLIQLNLPHLTVSRSAIINGQGDLTNSSADSNWSIYSTNVWNDRQGGSAVLSNLVGTVAGNVTNFISLSTTNATSKPLTNSYTAGVLTMFGIEQGSGHAITMNASNIVSANDWAQTASTTNIVGVSNWVNSVSNYVTAATNSASVTNWITQRQPASTILTNLSGTGAITNVFSASLSNATMKPVVVPSADNFATNYTGQFYGLEQGANITLTPNGSNIVIASTASAGGDTLWTNEPAGRIHPIEFTNRVEVQRVFTVGTNTSGFMTINSNDLYVGYRDLTKGERVNPKFSVGTYSNSSFSQLDSILNHRASIFKVKAQDDNLNTSGIELTSAIASGPDLYMYGTNGSTVFEISEGGLMIVNTVLYTWPAVQGGVGTVLTNDGSGNLGWGTDQNSGGLTTNANQFLGVPLSIKSGALLTNSLLRNVTNTIRLNLVQGTPISWPSITLEETTPGGTELRLVGSLNVSDSVVIQTNLAIQAGEPQAVVGYVWTLTNAASGTGTWSNAPAASGTPGGLDMAIQFNQDGTAFAGTNKLRFDRTNHVVLITTPSSTAPGLKIDGSTFDLYLTPKSVMSSNGPLTMQAGASTNAFTISSTTGTFTPATHVRQNFGNIGARWNTNFANTVNVSNAMLNGPDTGYTVLAAGDNNATNKILFFLGSNTVAAGQLFKIHSTSISDGLNTIALTNDVNSAQPASETLTNLAGTGAITNLFSPTLSNATIKPLVVGVGNAAGATNTTGEIRGLEAAANVTLTPNGSNYVIGVSGLTNTPIVAVGNLHVTNQLLRVNEEFDGKTVFTNLDFTGSIIKTMTNAITGSRTNNLTNAVGGASMIVYVVGDNATAGDFNYTFTAASANIKWVNSPTNTSSISVLIHSNQVYTFWFDVVTNATGPATNIIARWMTDSQRPILNKLVPVSAGAGTSNAWVGGRVFLDAVTASTNHTGTANYTNLFTFTVPGNTLTNEEDEIEFYLSGQFRFHTATTNGFKCIYGTSTIFDTGFITASNCPWKANIRITRTGNSSQRVEAEVRWNVNTAIASFGNGTLSTFATNMPLAQVNGTTNIFAFQGQSRIAAAITNDYKLVRWNPGTRGSVP